ncbi:unnamed protein product [Lepidochelys kempii]
MPPGVYNEVVSLLAHTDDQDKGKIALRIAFIAEPKLAIVLRVLLEKLQKDEQSRVDIYCALEKVLQQDTQGLERRLLEKIITLASNHMRVTQEATNELKVAASNTLVTLARCCFNDVMCELLYRLELPEEFIFITLGNLSSAYALECIPFVGMILNVMISMLELVKDSRMRQAFCGVLERCSKALKQAIIKALCPMMSLLLHRKEPQNPIFKEISWLLEQYKEGPLWVPARCVRPALKQHGMAPGAVESHTRVSADLGGDRVAPRVDHDGTETEEA